MGSFGALLLPLMAYSYLPIVVHCYLPITDRDYYLNFFDGLDDFNQIIESKKEEIMNKDFEKEKGVTCQVLKPDRSFYKRNYQ
jgi:hypothetical protein